MNSLRILLDMDGVLTDFTGGACRVHGWTEPELRAVWEPGTWHLPTPMGLTEDDWWAPINTEGEAFWTALEPLPWAAELLRLVGSLTDDWFIVTAPSREIGSYVGKLKWCKSYFGPHFDRMLPTAYKEVCANPWAILIDDRESNIINFEKHGGDGLLFPAYCNRLHQFADDPLSVLRPILEERFKAVKTLPKGNG